MRFAIFTMAGGRRIAIRRDLIRAIEDAGGKTVIYINETAMEPYGTTTQVVVEDEFHSVFSRLNTSISVRGCRAETAGDDN